MSKYYLDLNLLGENTQDGFIIDAGRMANFIKVNRKNIVNEINSNMSTQRSGIKTGNIISTDEVILYKPHDIAKIVIKVDTELIKLIEAIETVLDEVIEKLCAFVIFEGFEIVDLNYQYVHRCSYPSIIPRLVLFSGCNITNAYIHSSEYLCLDMDIGNNRSMQ